LQPTAWGWKLEDILTAVHTDCPTAPDTLLNMISCGCKADGRAVSCGCVKIGVHCSVLWKSARVRLVTMKHQPDPDGEIEQLTPVSPETDDGDDDQWASLKLID